MISTKETPLYFFEYLLVNFNEFIEEKFYFDYRNQLSQVGVDKENKTIVYILTGENGEETEYKETETLFLTTRCNQEFHKSIKLIEEQVNKQVNLTGNANAFLTLIEGKLITLFNQSSGFKHFNLKHFIQLLILDFNKKYRAIFKTNSEFITIVKLITNNAQIPVKGKTILAFQWKQEPEKLNTLYETLTSSVPPFIECEKETFIKAFNKGEMFNSEGIKWICYQKKNKEQPSYVSLYRFVELLFKKGFLIMEDYNDINKILEHIFLNPSGIEIKDKIKQAKREKSKNPSRFDELEEIVNRLF